MGKVTEYVCSMHEKDQANRRPQGSLSVNYGELHLLSSLAFFIVMFPVR